MENTEILLKQNPLYRYADQRVQLALSHINHYLMHYDPEALHQLRVEMKRLKALHQALTMLKPDEQEHIKWPLQMTLFYKLAGKVRSAHLLKQRLARQGWDMIAPDLFKKVFKTQLKFNKLLVKEAAEFNQILQTWGDKLVQHTADIDLASFELMVVHEKQKLLALMNPLPEEADWHEVRKEAKRFLHLSEMLSVRALARVKEGIDMKKIELLQENLGAWNDAREQSKWLKKKYKLKLLSKDAYQIISQYLSEKLLQNRLKVLTALK